MGTRYQGLLQERANLVAEARGIFTAAETESRDLTEPEKARDDAINVRLEAVAAELVREERRRENERTAPAMPDGDATGRITEIRDRPLDRPWGQQWQQAGAKPEIVKAAAFGEWLHSVYLAKTGHGTDPRLLYQAAAQGAGEAIGADGGFLVRQDVEDDIRLRMFTGAVLSRVDRRSLSGPVNSIVYNMIDESSRATGSRFGAVQGYWVDEGTTIPGSRPKTWKLALTLSKVAALGYATDELLADTVEFGRTMLDAFSEELRFLVENSIIRGTGVGSPTGVIAHAATVSVAKETGQGALTVVKENIDKMWARFYAPARANGVWFINQDIEPQLEDLQMVIGTGGVPVYMAPGGITETPFARLKGRPVLPIEYCSTLGTVGDIILMAPSEYRFIDKGGPLQANSMHVAFATDEEAFRVTYRADGKPKWRTTLTPFQGTATLSPFVTLATRA